MCKTISIVTQQLPSFFSAILAKGLINWLASLIEVDVSHSLNISVPRVNLKSQRQNVLCNSATDVVHAFWRLYSDLKPLTSVGITTHLAKEICRLREVDYKETPTNAPNISLLFLYFTSYILTCSNPVDFHEENGGHSSQEHAAAVICHKRILADFQFSTRCSQAAPHLNTDWARLFLNWLIRREHSVYCDSTINTTTLPVRDEELKFIMCSIRRCPSPYEEG